MKSMSMEWFFPTPVGIFDLSHLVTDQVNKILQNIGYAQNDLVDGIRGTKDPSKIPELQFLYDEFQDCINEYSHNVGIKNSTIYESWMNILTMNGSVGVHRHYQSVVSGAYYPYVDDKSAPLVFVNTLDGYRMLDGDTEIQGTNSPYAGNVRKIEAQSGRLVLFPGWAQHYVPPNRTNMRITLSFNTKF